MVNKIQITENDIRQMVSECIKRVLIKEDAMSDVLGQIKNNPQNQEKAKEAVHTLLQDPQIVKKVLGDIVKLSPATLPLNAAKQAYKNFKRGMKFGDAVKGGIKGATDDLGDEQKKYRKVLFSIIKTPSVAMAVVRVIATQGSDVKADAVVISAFAEAYAREEGLLKESIMNELQLSEPILNGEDANMMIGRYQPFTLGHLKCVEQMKQRLGVKTVIFSTIGDGSAKKPFQGELQNKMLEKIKAAYPDLIIDIKYIPKAAIDIMVNDVRNEGYEPISWCCGNDEFDLYDKYIVNNPKYNYREQLQLGDNFAVNLIERFDDNISGTKVREALMNDDREMYMKLMPECLYAMYDEFREELQKINGGL